MLVQSRGYTATFGRKLQQGTPELPAEALPAVPEMIEPFAAMTPSMTAEAPAPSMSAEAPMTAPGAAHHAIPDHHKNICSALSNTSNLFLHVSM